jgi:hypothetical protein
MRRARAGAQAGRDVGRRHQCFVPEKGLGDTARKKRTSSLFCTKECPHANRNRKRSETGLGRVAGRQRTRTDVDPAAEARCDGGFAQCYLGDVVNSAITLAELEYGVWLALAKRASAMPMLDLVSGGGAQRAFWRRRRRGLRAGASGNARPQARCLGQLDCAARTGTGRGAGHQQHGGFR